MADDRSQPNATKHQFSSFDPAGLQEATERAKLRECTVYCINNA